MKVPNLMLNQIRRISPSRYSSMRTCLLREAWASSGNDFLLPPSPVADLGTAIHQLLENAGRGRLGEATKKQVSEAVSELIDNIEKQMLKSPIRRQLVPLSKTIPDYEVRVLRACKEAGDIAREYKKTLGSSEPDAKSRIGFEVWIETADGSVGGFIDLVMRDEKGIILVDYKSGHVLEGKDGSCEIKVGYKEQMMLYAAMFYEKYGEWPRRLNIVPLQGQALTVRCVSDSALDLLGSARAMFLKANELIADVQTGTAQLSELASPSPDSCSFCLYRPGCQAYWTVRGNNPTKKWPNDMRGNLREIATLRNGTYCLIVDSVPLERRDLARVRNINSLIYRHPIMADLRNGIQIGIYCLRILPGTADFAETERTVIYHVEPH